MILDQQKLQNVHWSKFVIEYRLVQKLRTPQSDVLNFCTKRYIVFNLCY